MSGGAHNVNPHQGCMYYSLLAQVINTNMADAIKQSPERLSLLSKAILCINTNPLDPEVEVVHHDASFRIEPGLVSEFWEGGRQPAPDVRSINVDLQDNYVCTGLIECHVHLTAAPIDVTLKSMYTAETSTLAFRSAYRPCELLLRGFTTVRDM